MKLRGLCNSTIETYFSAYNIFMKFRGSRPIDKELIQEYLVTHSNRRNNLAMLRLLYPDETRGLKFPRRVWKPKILPNKEQLKTFYNALPEQYRVIFILLAESGLRVSELLNAEFDKNNKMIIPNGHNGQTKHSWISFYCTDFNDLPKITVDGLNHIFLKTSRKCGVTVYPHLLRAIFTKEASLGGMPSHYIDLFCGRVPSNIIRYYMDCSPETLKSIYSNAKINILD